MRDYHKLEVWERSMTLAVRLYEFAAQLPDEEKYNLASQLRRAATSTPLNIAEGSGCDSDPEFAKFLGYSYRSLKRGRDDHRALPSHLPRPAADACWPADRRDRRNRPHVEGVHGPLDTPSFARTNQPQR